MNWKNHWLTSILFISLSGCAAVPPSSLRTGLYSSTTGVRLQTSYGTTPKGPLDQQRVINPAPFYDYDVIRYTVDKSQCSSTVHTPDFNKAHYQATQIPGMPGVLMFTSAGLAMDEAEVANIEWRQFELASIAAGASPIEVVPDSNALPISDYYTSPFYAYYPVVGISYEQAQRFCKWRTMVVNEQLAQAQTLAKVVCEYRLPTEAEWEEAAGNQSGHPYGVACTEWPIRVAKGAASYLQKRAGSHTDIAQIKADIVAYNKQHTVRSWINYAQAEPYFLRLATPGYVFQGPPNSFGLLHMLGNVAEMVQERSVTKGGSYRDNLEACRINARGHYGGPAPTVGFRAVCSVRRLP